MVLGEEILIQTVLNFKRVIATVTEEMINLNHSF